MRKHPVRRVVVSLRQIAMRLALVLAAIGGTSSLVSQETAYDESQVKAAFLYRFGSYVQWPDGAAASDPITIAVLGDDEVAAQLAAYLPGRRIQGRAVEMRRIDVIEDLDEEEVVFIGSAHNTRLEELLDAIGPRAVLAVSDAENGLDRGAMINFRLLESRVRFEVSVPRAEESGLTLSSRLLSAAFRVRTR